MKNYFYLFILITGSFCLQSCLQDKCDAVREYIQYDPVYMTAEQIRAGISLEEPRTLEDPGRLYLYDQYLFINDAGKGIHIYDNSDKTNPQNIGFISIPGNFDLAIRDNILYADNTMDLIAIDISDMSNIALIERIEDAFTHYESNLGYVIYNRKTNIIESVRCDQPEFGLNQFNRENVVFIDASTDPTFETFDSNSSGSGVTGIGGSTAKFTISGQYLYTIDYTDLKTWDIASSIENLSVNNVGWGIETIFPYEDKLFIGSATGLYIFNNSNPVMPIQTAVFTHARACDPVVVKENTAYVTLRNGTQCESFTNQLEVIDITDIYNPSLIESFGMKNPHGLSIRDNKLYIAEGNHGWRIFDATNDEKVGDKEIKSIDNIHAVDVIALANQTTLVIGEDGFYQYDVSNPNNPSLLSKIEVD